MAAFRGLSFVERIQTPHQLRPKLRYVQLACVSSPARGEVDSRRRWCLKWERKSWHPTSPLVGEDRKSPRAEGDWLDGLGEGLSNDASPLDLALLVHFHQPEG